jgi:hypothetical protein
MQRFLTKYRPICLLQVIYKIITKTTTIRVEPLMSKLISGCQSDFIKGRNIMDGVLSVHEIIHQAKRKNHQGIILKLDFEKRTTRLTGSIFSNAFSQKGFSAPWCKIFDLVIPNGTLYMEINLKGGNDFGSHRGVRQGDPLSPFLSNLSAKGLANMIHQA